MNQAKERTRAKALGPEVVDVFQDSQEASVAGMEWTEGRVGRGECREVKGIWL